MPYYCYQCERTVNADEHLRCERCQGEFIEEVNLSSLQPDDAPNDTLPPETFDTRDLINNLLESFFAAPPRQQPSAASSRATGGASTSADEPVRSFFNSILSRFQPGGGPSGSRAAAGDANDAASSQDADTTAGSLGTEGSEPPQHHQPPTAAPFVDFMNQLLANISASAPDGTRVHIQLAGPTPLFQGNVNNYIIGEQAFDQFISNLLNNIEPQPHGLSDEEIQRLPMSNVTEKHVSNGVQCTTCMETFELNESVVQLDCAHIFHKDCIVPWLKKQKTCPICRKEVDSSKWPPGPDAPVPPKKSEFEDVDDLD